ncbi:MAG: RICIN domain-containing protein [Oscillospiraceae bacterium]|nr:RICIN domain-containing protein [Oscillospiraceae bacterium]
MKKITFMLLCLTLCLSLSLSGFAAVITVDGNEVNQLDAAGNPVPEVEGDSLVPLRAVINALGYTVSLDEETGVVKAGTFADPEFVFTPGEDGTVLVDGTTFIDAERIAEALPFELQTEDGTIAYTNTFTEMTEGWYKLSLGGRLLTARTLPEADLVETKTNEDGTEEEVVKTPTQQILATELFLAEDNGSDYQLWLMRKIGNKTYALINKATGLAADVNNWGRENGAKIIQYTLAGGTNQQFTFAPIDDGYSISPVYSRLYLTNVADDKFATELSENVVIQSADESVKWNLEFVEGYTNPVELAPQTEAFAELDPHIQERFTSYFFTDVDFSKTAKDKAEIFLRGKDFAHQDKAAQQQLIKDSLSVTYSDLLGGWMREKLTANYEVVSVTRTHDTSPEVLEQEDGKDYYIWTIAMECTGPEDIHTFTVETIDPDDEEHVMKVCEAVACFEPPVRKTLRHFYYTGDNFGTWNAWDGEIWNNTASKFDVNGMLTMFAHELGHVIDSDFKVGDDVWRRAINADIVPTSGYGQTNRWEDFGEFSRLYLMARGDADRIAAIEKIYPLRTKTYRAALYNIDNNYYAQYKNEFDELTAPIGDTAALDGEMYYAIRHGNEVDTTPGSETYGQLVPADLALTNNSGVVTFEEYTGADNQLWQFSIENEQLVRIFSKEDGTSLTVPGVFPNTRIVSDSNDGTLFGAKVTDNSGLLSVTFRASDTAFGLIEGTYVGTDEINIETNIGARQEFYLAPIEKVSGMGEFTIKAGDKYLAPETEERGARLALSDDDAMSVWYINKLPNGVGYITNTANDMAIDISGASIDDGAAALTYTLSRNANQMWLIIQNDNGTVSFQAQHSELYLAVDEEGKAIQSATPFEWTVEAAE